jgi:hypothetical protein
MSSHVLSRTARGLGAGALCGALLALAPAAASAQHRYWVSVSGTHSMDVDTVNPLNAEYCSGGDADQYRDRETVRTVSRGILTVIPRRGQDPESYNTTRAAKLGIKGGSRGETLYTHERRLGECVRIDKPYPPTINTCRTPREQSTVLNLRVAWASRPRARISIDWPSALPGCGTRTLGKPATATVSLARLRAGRAIHARLSLERTESDATSKSIESQRFDVVLSPMLRR